MRNRAYSNSPRIRISLALLGTLLAALALAGCGGGGGGGGDNGGGNGGGGGGGGSADLATVTGKVLDNSSSHNPVPGAAVAIVGTDRSGVTGSDGIFTISNVPLTATQFTVSSPDPFTWYNYAQYSSKQYDTAKCKLPLPSLAKGVNSTGDVWLYNGGQNPPPPPPIGGCP